MGPHFFRRAFVKAVADFVYRGLSRARGAPWPSRSTPHPEMACKYMACKYKDEAKGPRSHRRLTESSTGFQELTRHKRAKGGGLVAAAAYSC